MRTTFERRFFEESDILYYSLPDFFQSGNPSVNFTVSTVQDPSKNVFYGEWIETNHSLRISVKNGTNYTATNIIEFYILFDFLLALPYDGVMPGTYSDMTWYFNNKNHVTKEILFICSSVICTIFDRNP